MGNLHHLLQERNINLFLGLEMGEETALGHANLAGQYTDGHSSKA
jgi:hypothetical protein